MSNLSTLGLDMSGRNKNSKGNDEENIWVFSPGNDAPKNHINSQIIHDNNSSNTFIEINKSNNELTHKIEFTQLSLRHNLKMRLELTIANSKDWLMAQLTYERDQGNLFNIAPIIFGVGIWTYFSVAFEPNLQIVIASLIAIIISTIKIHSRGMLFHFAVTIALFLGGMVAAQLQVKRTQMQVPSAQITSNIRGIVLKVDKNTRGSPRYFIRPTYIEKLGNNKLPTGIRISTSKKYKKYIPGDTITGLARLTPLSGPAYPGGYDFAFFAWFKGHAMSGFFMGEPTHSTITISKSISERIFIEIANWRGSVSTRIRAGINGEPGELAVALITGDRSGLSIKTKESLRKSGLAHILAISGLHMALVTLTMVWLVRSLLLLIPNFAHKYSIKKWAIGAGFIVATFYLFLSGNAIATQRAWIMISIMMLANLLDRPAITIRSVAVAALLILLLFPASLFSPGFQMSFAAVLALVSIYRAWSKRQLHKTKIKKDRGIVLNAIGSVFKYGMGLSLTSLIAGTATAFFAAWHFHRIAPLGFIANLGAMPIVSALVMPLALISVLLMPYGLEGLTLIPLGLAIEAVVWISDKTNSIPIDFSTGIQSKQMLYSSLAMLAFALLPVDKLRYVAIIPTLALIYFMAQRQPIPHLLIAQDGRTIAAATSLLNKNNTVESDTDISILNGASIYTGQGALTLLYPRRNKFVSQIWLKAYSGGVSGNSKSNTKRNTNSNCDKEQCKFMLGNISVYIIYNPKLISNACKYADILAAPRLRYVRCKTKKPKVILKRQDFEKNGSHAIWLTSKNVKQLKAEQTSIRIDTAWRAVDIAPTPDHYVEPSTNINNTIDSKLNKTRRPWLRRYDLPKTYNPKKPSRQNIKKKQS